MQDYEGFFDDERVEEDDPLQPVWIDHVRRIGDLIDQMATQGRFDNVGDAHTGGESAEVHNGEGTAN